MFVTLMNLLLLQLLNCRLVYTQADSTETVRLRLENGGSPCAGRVEIHYKGLWGTVYHGKWDVNDATVVCRELECGNAVSALGNAHFGQGSGPILTWGVECNGDERALRECQSARWDHYKLSHANDAGVICSEHIIPRLVPGNSQCFGRLEVQFGDTWKTVCGLDWDLKNANVVCAHLHCGVAVSVSSSAHSGGNVLLTNEVFECAGNETQLWKCPRSSDTHQDCSGHNNVSLICSENHDLRLVDGENKCSGRVEVLHGNQWGTLCGDFFGLQDASVVCEQLQCGVVKSIARDFRSGTGGGLVWKENYRCRGNERRLWDCPVSHGENFMCSRDQVVNVLCSDENWALRLANGGSRCDGLVEVYYNGSWGGLQNTLWDRSDADVVCRQLGCGYASETYNSSRYGESDNRSWLLGVQCHGQEPQLRNCRTFGSFNWSGTASSGAGVTCSEHLELRLSDGGSPCAGRVEIYYNGTWGSVCDDSWDVVDAEVVCKQLECGNALDMTFPSSYGTGSGPVWLKDVKCSGNESFLWECPSAQLGHQDDCSHKEDVRIMCSEHREMRLVNGKHRCEGRVEVFYNGTWGTVCSESLDFRDAEVICKQLHCGVVKDVMYDSQLFGGGSGPILLDEIECQSHESTLWQCRTGLLDQHGCDHRDDAGVVCSERDVRKEKSPISNSCHQQSDSQDSVRLNGGNSTCSGTVEIMCDERWGALCGDSWDTVDANVVCRQLRCGFALSAQGGPAVSQGKGVIWQNSVKCKGRETSLSYCLSPAPTQRECNHKEIASVICSGSDVLTTSPSPPPAGQDSQSISMPVVVCLTLGVLLICDLIALLVVMQRKSRMKDLYTVGKGSNLGLYPGIYEEIENIPPGKMMHQELEPVISASIDSLNHIEYYTSHNSIDNNLGSEDREVNFNSISGPVRGYYDDIETEGAECQDGQLQLDSDPGETVTLTNDANSFCSHGK